VADPSFERMFYKLAGFRFLGKRAVRIDILERLADLIRPLLQWKPGTTPRPEGAYDGRRFTTTTAMLSILGATPDDMEEILKGLGYRADAVKPEEAQAFLGSQDKSAAPATAPASEAAASSDDAAEASDASAEDRAAAPEAEATTGETTAVETQPAEVQGPETQAAPEADAPEAAGSEDAAPATDAAAEKPAEAEEAKPVLLWRPGGGRETNQRGGRPQQHGDRRGQGGQRAAGAEDGQSQGRRDGRRDGERREGRGNGGERRDGGRPNRDNNRRPEGGRSEGGRADGGRPDRQERGERQDRPDRNKSAQPARFESKPPRKEKAIDPDSPFAKLAALKEQMKK
jgi:ATP-dependent RNA helicase SUPV3L1/SUV3